MRWSFAALVLTGLVVGSCSPGSASESQRPNVVFICIDTLRADHLGCYGYNARDTSPTLDALAGNSTVFYDTSATAGWTKPSVPSYLTSTYPLQHGAYLGDSKGRLETTTDALPADAHTIAEVFLAGGYQTAAFVRNAQLRKGLGFEQGFEVYEDKPGDAREIRWRAQDWLQSRQQESPFFLYLHFLDAHWPYPVPHEYAFKYVDADQAQRFQRKDWRTLRKAINKGEVRLEAGEVEALVALYDGAIRYVDDQIGQLIETLEREGLADNTIICVIADHGEEFMEHGKIGHGHGLYENLLRVPWILHLPGEAGRVVNEACSLVDVMPTLAAAANLDAGEHVMGVNLLDRIPSERMIFAEHLNESYYQQAFRQSDGKLVVELNPGAGLKAPSTLRHLDPKLRWKAELDPDAEEWTALKVQPDEGEDVMDPLEIKAQVQELHGSHFEVAGVPVVMSRSTVFYGEGALTQQIGDVAEGRLVKVKGVLDDDGILSPIKIKVYADSAELELEIRGRLLNDGQGGRLNIGGVWIATDDRTEFRGADQDNRPELSRELLYDVFTGSEGVTQDDRISVQASLFGLNVDPGERNATEVDSILGAVAPTQEFVRMLASTRFWGSGDRVTLTPEALEELKAIGYAE